MKTERLMTGLMVVGSVLLATGCVERRVVYVPAYPPPPAYVYSTQASVPTAPITAQAGFPQTTANLAPATAAPVPQATATVVVPAAPPPAQVEVVPVTPGPDYVWAPGYWGWNGGAWVWIGGNWVIRPHVGAVWVGGHWGRQGRGYVWLGGHWR